MKAKQFNLAYEIPEIVELVGKIDKKILAIWASACVERVFHLFKQDFPNDPRPRVALDTLQNWIETREFKMSVIRSASLNSHAAAREVGKDNSARSVARAAGQAVATAHVFTHSLGAVLYALQAIYRNTDPSSAIEMVEEERKWQYQKLRELSNSSD